jgi:hypothetical protein
MRTNGTASQERHATLRARPLQSFSKLFNPTTAKNTLIPCIRPLAVELTCSMEQVNALVQKREFEVSERARKLRLRELWKEAWSSVDLTPPHIPLLEPRPTGTATHPSDTIHSISPLATLISPVSTPTTCPSVPSHSAGELMIGILERIRHVRHGIVSSIFQSKYTSFLSPHTLGVLG